MACTNDVSNSIVLGEGHQGCDPYWQVSQKDKKNRCFYQMSCFLMFQERNLENVIEGLGWSTACWGLTHRHRSGARASGTKRDGFWRSATDGPRTNIDHLNPSIYVYIIYVYFIYLSDDIGCAFHTGSGSCIVSGKTAQSIVWGCCWRTHCEKTGLGRASFKDGRCQLVLSLEYLEWSSSIAKWIPVSTPRNQGF